MELLQETHVVFEEKTEVVDLIFEHSDAFYAHAEGIAGIFLWVYLAVFEHSWVYHAAAAYLYPAALFAHGAAFLVADKTRDIYFCARLGKGEK